MFPETSVQDFPMWLVVGIEVYEVALQHCGNILLDGFTNASISVLCRLLILEVLEAE